MFGRLHFFCPILIFDVKGRAIRRHTGKVKTDMSFSSPISCESQYSAMIFKSRLYSFDQNKTIKLTSKFIWICKYFEIVKNIF